MNPILRNIIALIIGLIFGSLVNMGIITISGSIIPPPEGADVTTMEGLQAAMHLFKPKHFIMPFIAHALGTFSGAFVAAKIAVSHQLKFSLGVGVLFLVGGIANIYTLPSPTWFAIVDLVGAYIPMAWIGHHFTLKK